MLHQINDHNAPEITPPVAPTSYNSSPYVPTIVDGASEELVSDFESKDDEGLEE